MLEESRTLRLELKAGISAYLVLTLPFAVLAIGFLLLQSINPSSNSWQGALLSFTACMILLVWVSGFRVKFENGEFEYRDGLYRCTKVHLADVSGIRLVWIKWPILSSAFSVPRLVVGTRQDPNAVAINPKPFSRKSLDIFRRIIKKIVSE
jgi:hypothetical protein